MNIPKEAHVKDLAEEVLHDLRRVCAKHKCILTAGNGVFYLAKILTDLPPQATAIAQVREINPGLIEWAPADILKVPKGAVS